MNLHALRQRCGLRTCAAPARFGRGPRLVTKAAGLLLISLLSASQAYALAPTATPTPPPVPQVPPVISRDYGTDLNGNGIHDALETLARSSGGISIASAEGEMVRVELIFAGSVTQHQIDEFLRLGGQITYLYRATSYGWTGRIPQESLASLPAAMGPTLVRVEPIRRLGPYLDVATKTGRIRLVWKAGFAGDPTGLSGDSNTTIGFIGSGVDAKHTDLQGRGVYWRDFSDDNEPQPVDYEGHESAVAGVALGTGAAGGAKDGTLRYTYQDRWASYFHMAYPICPPPGLTTISSAATWTGPAAYFAHYSWIKGTAGTSLKYLGTYMRGRSPLTIINTLNLVSDDPLGVTLAELDNLKSLANVVLTTSVSPYPGVGDGFNTFRGVAPGCQWAAAKVLNKDGNADSEQFTAAFDDMVLHRKELNIKIINVSFGLEDDLGFPEESSALRDKVNSAVHNGILVVAAAGNNATKSSASWRRMADPPRAALAITVGATNDGNGLTEYSNSGFPNPRRDSGEDFKPDVVAPGGSQYYTGIMTVDSDTSDAGGPDREPSDYANEGGTSFAAPFVAGSAALVIQAMERHGIPWRFDSAEQPKYVKMLLCATASELTTKREGTDRSLDPTLQRTVAGPNGFPPGKDPQEGYGIINPDAAAEAVCLTLAMYSTVSADLGGDATAKRVWARAISLTAGRDTGTVLTNPAGGDFDLYLYSTIPTETGVPVVLASSTLAGAGVAESLHFTAPANMPAFLVVKRISGTGTFTLRLTQDGPPIAAAIQGFCDIDASTTITFQAVDDGLPNPTSYTILSRPAHGHLELPNGIPIIDLPAKLPNAGNKVVYRPPNDWSGQDSFTFCADDGGVAPTGGPSSPATVAITVGKQLTVEYQVVDGADDAHGLPMGTGQVLSDQYLHIGNEVSGMRFRDVEVPHGATVIRASIKIYTYSPWGDPTSVDGVLQGEAADNPPAFANASRLIWQLPTTAAAVDWKCTPAARWANNAWYESPDIGPIIQEIVNRPGWASGNALVLLYTINSPSGTRDRTFWGYYDSNPGVAPKLSITYQVK